MAPNLRIRVGEPFNETMPKIISTGKSGMTHIKRGRATGNAARPPMVERNQMITKSFAVMVS